MTDPTRYGLVETDENNRVRRFLEKPKPEEVTTDTINAGAKGLSRIADGEMARINIEASTALERWIDLRRSEPDRVSA